MLAEVWGSGYKSPTAAPFGLGFCVLFSSGRTVGDVFEVDEQVGMLVKLRPVQEESSRAFLVIQHIW